MGAAEARTATGTGSGDRIGPGGSGTSGSGRSSGGGNGRIECTSVTRRYPRGGSTRASEHIHWGCFSAGRTNRAHTGSFGDLP
jgi:hypothetical protein